MIRRLEWRMRAWPPTGGDPTEIGGALSVLRGSGLRAQLSPEGDTREVAMITRGLPRLPELAVGSLYAVQFQTRRASTEPWVSRWYAQVRQGGNLRNTSGENVVLRSLALRLKYVKFTPDFTAPAQDAHLTVQAMLQNVLPQLDGLILFDPALCPPLGFGCIEIKDASVTSPYALLEGVRQQGLASTPPVVVSFGVNADQYFFCRLAMEDVLELQDEDVLGVPEWREPVAEDPCTLVTWLLKQRTDGTWITHESPRMANDPFGSWNKTITVDATINPWTLVPGRYEWHQEGHPIQSSPASNHEELRDGQTTESYGSGGTTSEIFLQFVPDPGETWTRAVIVGSAVDSGGPSLTMTGDKPPETTIAPNTLYASGNVALGWVSTEVYPQTGRGARVPFIATGRTDPVYRLASVHVAELRVERINTALLDGLARFHYATPAQEPADITLRDDLTPAQFRGQVAWGTYGRSVEAYELRLTAKEGLRTGLLTGQVGDPATLAQASLIKGRDQGAVVSAVTAQR
ncbi:hypothetical protein [uncultured Deinococcus sp.]|uniref:hypothetical protein n=1 Tax=uncultured Deinococcus sp. TaxID=158789 RepID=UPI0025DB4721|nr:hypothetical protein [uncultured Deinococcus sp.]